MKDKSKKMFIFIALFIINLLIVPNVYAAEGEAKVDGELMSFTAALEKVKSTGGTIELQKEVVLEKMVDLSVDNPVTINMNSFNISCSAAATNFIIRKGEIKFTGSGKIQNNYPKKNQTGTLYVKGSNNSSDKNYTHLIIDKDVSVEGYNPIVVDAYSGSVPNCYGAVVDVYGKLKTLPGYGVAAGITVVASLKDIDNAPVINIHDDAVLSNEVEAGLGMNLMGYAETNVGKATIEAHTGIFATAGSINLAGTIIKATGNKDYKEQYKTSGPTGAAIQLEAKSDRAGNIEVNINGGSYTSEYNSALVEYSNGATETSVKEIHISDGEFKSAEGHDTIDTSDSFKNNNKEFITGGNFLSGDEKYDVSQYIKSEFLQNADGTVVPPTPEKPTPTTPSKPTQPEPSNPDVNGDQDDVPNTGVENPQTRDGIITYIIMGTLSLLGLAGVTTKKLLLNER